MDSVRVFFFIAIVIMCLVLGVAIGMDKTSREKVEDENRKAGEHKIVCPQCHERGYVTTVRTFEKTGLHGGKATAAILTGGVSMLATGLSNEVGRTKATCSNCGSVWCF